MATLRRASRPTLWRKLKGWPRSIKVFQYFAQSQLWRCVTLRPDTGYYGGPLGSIAIRLSELLNLDGFQYIKHFLVDLRIPFYYHPVGAEKNLGPNDSTTKKRQEITQYFINYQRILSAATTLSTLDLKLTFFALIPTYRKFPNDIFIQLNSTIADPIHLIPASMRSIILEASSPPPLQSHLLANPNTAANFTAISLSRCSVTTWLLSLPTFINLTFLKDEESSAKRHR